MLEKMERNNEENEEPRSSAPEPHRWYDITLGPSFKDDHPSSKFCTLRYEFKPASIDNNQPGLLHKTLENRVTVEFHNNQQGKPKVRFEGVAEDYRENEAVLFFDGETFRLEQLHRAIKRLRHVRLPGESTAAANVVTTTSVGAAAESNLRLLGEDTEIQPLNRGLVHQEQVTVERIGVDSSESLGAKSTDQKDVCASSSSPNPLLSSQEHKESELEEHLHRVNNDDDGHGTADKGTATKREFSTGIDINLPHPVDMDDIEIAEVVSDDEVDGNCNAAEALRAQVNAEGREKSSSSNSSSVSDSSSSGSGSRSRSRSETGSESESGSGSSSSSDTDISDGDSVISV
ncbi:Ell-associated factor Eaf like [Quillaja saponaria]|uniref:Ell-associated factor Eaf like n=1 Tax=Quillaja saponaria TaxID=32244 RepID=A0AAD7PY08_QUISA|nr:Ell-associated factor Eaf like [Quillaja saponaria]